MTNSENVKKASAPNNVCCKNSTTKHCTPEQQTKWKQLFVPINPVIILLRGLWRF